MLSENKQIYDPLLVNRFFHIFAAILHNNLSSVQFNTVFHEAAHIVLSQNVICTLNPHWH